MKRRLFLPLVLAVTAAAASLAACASKSAEASCSTARDCLPDVSYEGLHTKEVFPRARLTGKVVVVNFWATWCAPCKKEIPAFNKVFSEYESRGVMMLGVLYDTRVDETALLNFMSDNEMTYPVVRADRPVLEAYEYPEALPTTFVFDRAGKLVVAHRGPMTEQELRSVLDKELR